MPATESIMANSDWITINLDIQEFGVMQGKCLTGRNRKHLSSEKKTNTCKKGLTQADGTTLSLGVDWVFASAGRAGYWSTCYLAMLHMLVAQRGGGKGGHFRMLSLKTV